MNSCTCSEQHLLKEGMPLVFYVLGVGETETSSMAYHRIGGNDILQIRFFKIILKTNLERIKIPNMFTRRYGGGLSNPVFVKPPDGTEWKVYWTKQNGEIWFEKGWKEFAEKYCLDNGYLVVFKYEGTSQFDVVILDQSALEIDYPQKARQKSPLFSPRPHKKMRGEKATQRTSSLNRPREVKAREVAKNFISCNPFFTVFLKPVHLAESQLSVPDLKGYIENKDKYVTLKLGKGSWHVKLLSSHKSRSRNRLSAGWSLFASETELQPGDVCVFELINREDSVFMVHVFKSRS
ncbi:B3 domain-containing transcription factor VRN1-like [Gastrolobium bilobum]|uniref:B3 domain-containing transcription factor VRN1-like n=1 Tax=Gastrolobium bilobum TaxID=150636 RepID=UPI002AB23D5A|nr:B3 domain-containing transcription factor VRN1-like [Gastrolobium bilobum]